MGKLCTLESSNKHNYAEQDEAVAAKKSDVSDTGKFSPAWDQRLGNTKLSKLWIFLINSNQSYATTFLLLVLVILKTRLGRMLGLR